LVSGERVPRETSIARAMMYHVALLGLATLVAGVPTIVLDNSVAELEGGMMCTGSGYDGSFHHNNGEMGSTQDFAVWNFNITQDGCYQIEEYHPASSCSGHALQHVPVRVDYCKGQMAWAHIDQASNGGRWNILGRLPFNVGWPSRILLTRRGLPNYVCPDGKCFWVGDAFRLTWLANTCHEADKQGERPTPREQVDAELDGDKGMASTGRSANKLAFVMQATLSEPHMISSTDATFSFRAPVDGCYIVEERHPYSPGHPDTEMAITFCRGFVARGSINHTDGRHEHWNYMASLPFYDDHDGSITLPRDVLQRAQEHRGDHQFRLTHVGARCNSPEAQVHKVVLRIHADFSLVQDRLKWFITAIQAKLASGAGIEAERIIISSIWPGSIVVEAMVMPAASARVPSADFGTPPTALSAAQALVGKAADVAFARQVCGLAGDTSASCGISIEANHRAPPRAKRSHGKHKKRHGKKDEGDNTLELVLIIGSSAVIISLALIGTCVAAKIVGKHKAKARQQKNYEAKKLAYPFENVDPIKHSEDPAPKARDFSAPTSDVDEEQPSVDTTTGEAEGEVDREETLEDEVDHAIPEDEEMPEQPRGSD